MPTNSIVDSSTTTRELPANRASEPTDGPIPVVLARVPLVSDNVVVEPSHTVNRPLGLDQHPQHQTQRVNRPVQLNRSAQPYDGNTDVPPREPPLQVASDPQEFTELNELLPNEFLQPSKEGVETFAAKNDFASRLCQIHAGIGPYAGVIVALALIASGGLLYWLILGPTGSSQDFPNDFGQEAEHQFSLEWPSDESQTTQLQPAETATIDGIVTDSAVDAWIQSSTTSAQQRVSSKAEIKVKTPSFPPSRRSPLPTDNSTDSQPAAMPSETQVYPTTDYAPIDFAAMQLSSPANAMVPEIVKLPSVDQTHSIAR